MRKLTFPGLLALGAAALWGCADGLEPIPFQGVSGTLAYISAPDSATTDWVRLAVYRELPETDTDLLDFEAFSDDLPIGDAPAPYWVPLEAGDYAWLVVVWKERGNENPLTALRAAGWYTAGAGPFELPVGFMVLAEGETGETDVSADFDNMLTIDEVLAFLSP
ncbi:MAG: hypothetical protein JSV86_04680 [Gemmatimonadota bacterium]|nr:MAG: hypothetical protein JSV86_04680 [Gemmatimonadota bacterium]